MIRVTLDIPEEYRNRASYALDYLLSHLDTGKVKTHLVYSSEKNDEADIWLPFHAEEYQQMGSRKIRADWDEDMPFLYLQRPEHRDVVFSTFLLLSGYQETICAARDEYGRYPYKDSIQYREKIAERAIVQEYASYLKKSIHQATGRPVSIVSDWSEPILLTHDIDRLHEWKGCRDALGRILDLFTGRVRYRKGAFRQVFDYLVLARDPFDTVRKIAKMEKKAGKTSIFFFMIEFGHELDGDYESDLPKLAGTMKWLLDGGFRLGLHGSYRSSGSCKLLGKEKERLEGFTGRPVSSIRQHYLRFTHLTSAHQVESGFEYDYSLGFPESPGFRNGTCRPFRPWDWEHDRPFDIIEIPLLFMDRTIIDYMKMDLEKALDRIKGLVETVKRYKGQGAILWHNDVFNDVKYPGYGKLYEKIMKIA